MKLVSSGCMFGDWETVKEIPYQTSLLCYSPQGQVLVLKKDDLIKHNIPANSEAWEYIMANSEQQQMELVSLYVDKL